MNKFEDELKTGNFVTSECNHCNRIVWPPSNYCDNCFIEGNWRKVSENGIIIEFSKKENLAKDKAAVQKTELKKKELETKKK